VRYHLVCGPGLLNRSPLDALGGESHVKNWHLLLFLLAVPLAAQPTPAVAAPPPATKLEAFEKQTGSVVVRGFTSIGSVRGTYDGTVSVEAREFLNATTTKREYGIVIETKESGRLERENRSFVDYDEIDSLLKGIDYITKIDASASKLGDFQADYRTKGELEVSTFSSQGGIMAAVTSGRIGSVMVIMGLSELAKFRTLIADAKAKIDTVRSGV
jgi:hypothetical protein